MRGDHRDGVSPTAAEKSRHGNNDNRDNEKKKKTPTEEQAQNKVSFFKLFSFADRLDVALMTVGTAAAVANGLSQPISTLIFGKIINSFGSSEQAEVLKEVSKVIVFHSRNQST